jgi:hypothetical protein
VSFMGEGGIRCIVRIDALAIVRILGLKKVSAGGLKLGNPLSDRIRRGRDTGIVTGQAP